MIESPENRNDLRFELVTDGGEQASDDPLQFIRSKLRGRYRVTILLGLLLALCGALIGYTVAPVKYESVGLIQFKPALPTILYKSVENQPTPLFDSFVSAQATLIRSRHVLEEALKDPIFKTLDPRYGALSVADLQGMLSVYSRRGEQMVTVTTTHRNPKLTQATTNAVLMAFDRTYHDPIRFNPTVREQKLVRREQQLQVQVQEIEGNILELSEQYGVETIKRQHTEKIQELIAIDQKLTELNLALTALELQSERADNGQPINIAMQYDSVAEILKIQGADSITGLRDQERAIMAELESFGGRFGARHPRIRDLNRRLDMIRIHMRLLDHGLMNRSDAPRSAKSDYSLLAQASIDRIREIESQYRTMRDRLRQEATILGNKSVKLTNYQEQAQTIKLRLTDTRKALDILRVESDRDESARIIIAAMGDLPSVPSTDRRQSMAMAAALFGMGMAACIVVVIGIFDPRCRFAQELEMIDKNTQVISLIPDISSNCPEIDKLAALGVHQLRNLLELQREDSHQGVYTITSPGRREGKTSLVLALGASFAIAGRRTLIIDADVDRAGLTNELHMQRLPGLWEAIDPLNGEGEVHQTDSDNLWALPVGVASNGDPREISRDKLVKLLDAVRPRFDVILIDTGPVMTSLEASLVASISDRVIMMVARNQHSAQVRASLERLRRIGAECKGMVFNLAPPSDFDRRDWHISQTSTHAAPLIPETPTNDRNLVGTIGSINDLSNNASMRKAA